MKENWKWIPGYRGRYKVSNLGRVFSYVKTSKGKILKQFACRRTHYMKTRLLHSNGTRYSRLIHRLVLRAFVGKPGEGQECRHINGNRQDNRLENLCWGTIFENAQDRQRHGTQVRGMDTNKAKLTDEQVMEIRERLDQGRGTLPCSALAEEYGVGAGRIQAIARGEAWRHVGGPDVSDRPKVQGRPPVAMDMTTARKVLDEYIAGATQAELAVKYGCSRPTISYVVNRKGTYSNLKGPKVERQHRKGGPKGITLEEAKEIRRIYRRNINATAKALAKRYGVDPKTIYLILWGQKRFEVLGGGPVRKAKLKIA